VFQKNSNTKSRLLHFFPLIIGITIILVLVRNSGVGQIQSIMESADYYIILFAIFLLAIEISLKVGRWNKIMPEIGYFSSYRICVITHGLNEVAVSGAGEIYNIYLCHIKHGISKGRTLMVNVVNRYCDVAFLTGLALMGGSFFLSYEINNLANFLIPIIVITAASILFFRPKLISYLVSFIDRYMGRIGNHLITPLDSFKKHIILFNSEKDFNKKALTCILLTILPWIINGFVHKSILYSLGYNLPITFILFVTSAAYIIGTFSFIPGGLGVRDVVYVTLLDTNAVPEEISLSAILINRFMLYVYFSLGTLISVYSYSYEKKNAD